MPGRSYRADERNLVELASTQGGFFTSKQAARYGYAAPKRHYHVRVGNWIRERRGIFRLSAYPLPERPDLILWWLWSRNQADQPQGVYSHQTALSLHGLTDLMPSRLHMTVPPNFRRSAPIPRSLKVHQAGLVEHEVERLDGVPVTNAIRTLLDLMTSGDVAVAGLRSALALATKSGTVTRAQIAAAETSAEWRDAIRTLQGSKR